MKKVTIIEIITILNIILFLYTGIAKIQDYALFKEQLAVSTLPASISRAIAFLLPIVEFAVVIMLAIPRWRLKGLYTTLSLLITFTGYIIILIITSDHLPCSCGGIIEQLSWQQHLIFNAVFIVLNTIAIRLYWTEKKELNRKLNIMKYYHVAHS